MSQEKRDIVLEHLKSQGDTVTQRDIPVGLPGMKFSIISEAKDATYEVAFTGSDVMIYFFAPFEISELDRINSFCEYALARLGGLNGGVREANERIDRITWESNFYHVLITADLNEVADERLGSFVKERINAFFNLKAVT